MLLTKSFFNPALLRSDLRRCWPLLAGYTFLWFLILPLRMWNGVAADLQASHPEDARRVALEIIGNATTAAIWIHLIFGIVLAMALFSYLSSARGTYGMHSFPASRGCQFRTHVLSCVGCVAVSNVLICLLSAQSGGTHWGGQPFLAGVLPGDLPAVFLPGYLLLYALRLAPGHGRGLRRGELRGHLLPYSGGRHVQHLLPQL